MGKAFLGAEFVPNLSSLEPKIGHEMLARGRDRYDRYVSGKVHRDRDLPGEQDSHQKLRLKTRFWGQIFSSGAVSMQLDTSQEQRTDESGVIATK